MDYFLLVRELEGIAVLVPTDEWMIGIYDDGGLGRGIGELTDGPAGMDQVLVAVVVLDAVVITAYVDLGSSSLGLVIKLHGHHQ